jgi:hypothetical protein
MSLAVKLSTIAVWKFIASRAVRSGGSLSAMTFSYSALSVLAGAATGDPPSAR